MATTQISTSDLEQEVKQLEYDLAKAEAARVSDADKHAAELRRKLEDKKADLRAAQDAEGQAVAVQQHQKRLQLLAEIDSDVTKAKTETTALRAAHTDLFGRISLAECRLNELLRLRAKLRVDVGFC